MRITDVAKTMLDKLSPEHAPISLLTPWPRKQSMRKGQAAMEFLMTYGWAMLIIIVMIGAITYFGVTNPKKLVPDTCVFASGLNCKEFIITSNDTSNTMYVKADVINNLGRSFSILSLSMTSGRDAANASSCTDYGGRLFNVGDVIPLECNFSNSGNMLSNENAKINVHVTYIFLECAFNKSFDGQVQALVEPKVN